MIANQNHFLDCICWAMVAIAARHGESSILNSKKENAAAVLGNQVLTPAATAIVSSTSSSSTLAKTPMVVTIASLAEKPEMEAATGCQLPKPRGAKIGAIRPPTIAIKLLAVSSTTPKEPFSIPKVDKTHITTQAKNRIVPAFLIKPQSRSQVCINTVFADGIW